MQHGFALLLGMMVGFGSRPACTTLGFVPGQTETPIPGLIEFVLVNVTMPLYTRFVRTRWAIHRLLLSERYLLDCS